MSEEKGCLDINECADSQSPCKNNQFCVNNDGSYKCLDCDRACAACTGDGPDMCTQCAPGFVLVNNMCTGLYICDSVAAETPYNTVFCYRCGTRKSETARLLDTLFNIFGSLHRYLYYFQQKYRCGCYRWYSRGYLHFCF